mgnify:CR=1 FL=1
MSDLPVLPVRSKHGQVQQIAFGGLRHFKNCTDGEIYDMQDMTCEEFPILSTRNNRMKTRRTQLGILQLYVCGGVTVEVKQSEVLINGLSLLVPQDAAHTRFVAFGNRVVMYPDKKLLNLTHPPLAILSAISELPEGAELYDAYAIHDEGKHYDIYVWDGNTWRNNGWLDTPMGATLAETSIKIKDGTLYNQDATANVIAVVHEMEYVTSSAGLKVGDAVRISGLTQVPGNNKIAIIREISPGGYLFSTGCSLHFSDFCFSIPESGGQPQAQYEETGSIRIERLVPDMDVLFSHGNRMWGAKGKELFASKLGDPTNWHVFDGLSTDSWYLSTQEPGDITGGVASGYPLFFRENGMTTVYGALPSAFQTQFTPLPGVKHGEKESLVSVAGALLWFSPEGMVLCSGESIVPQTQVFGDWQLSNIIAATDGRRYYMKAEIGAENDGEPMNAVFIWHADTGLWTKERDDSFVRLTADAENVYALESSGNLTMLHGSSRHCIWPASPVNSYVEFGDFTHETPNKKTADRLLMRLGVDAYTTLTVKIRYDSAGDWLTVGTITGATEKKTVLLPVMPKRCDHYRIRIEGVGRNAHSGNWRLYSVTKSVRIGAERN